MMRALAVHEGRRAMKGGGMVVSLLFGGMLSIMHIFTYVLPLSEYIYAGNYPIGAYEKWMGAVNNTIWPILFYLVVPLLSALPYLGSVSEDFSSGYVTHILLVAKRKEYAVVKWIVTFVSAGTAAIFPLVLNFFLTACILPMVKPQSGLGTYPIFPYSMWAELFYTHPGAYVLSYLVLDFLFFGLLATLGLTYGFLSQRNYICMMVPFLIYLLVYGITQMNGQHIWSLFAVLRPSQPVPADGWILLIEGTILFVVGGVIWLYGWKKRDVF